MNPLSLILPWWARWAAVAMLAIAVYGFGNIRGRAAVHAQWDAEKLAQAQANGAAIEAARNRGDMLTRKLQDQQGEINRLTKEKHDAIYSLTDGSRCLSPAAVSLLNRTGSDDVPQAAASAAAKDAGELAASDRDVAGWIAEARQQYETCAARLNSLIDFNL